MVRVALGLAEGAEQPTQLVRMVTRQPDGEVRSPEGRQQLGSLVTKLASPSQVDSTVRGEASEQGGERRSPDVVKRTEHRDASQRLAAEDVSVVCPSGVLGELGQRRWTPTDHDDAVVRGALVPQVRAEVLPRRLFSHVPW